MKSKILALSKNDDFKALVKGNKLSNKYATVFFKVIKNTNKKKLNISFVAKKKIGNAVQRNKIKRRLKNIFINLEKKIKMNFDYSYMILAKKNMLDGSYNTIKDTIYLDLKKIK